jgi:endonuclease I/endonuclease/exonuclease/phosphatase family metal-dependent hydrolase
MVLSRVAALALSSAMLASGAAAESVKVAAWNMNNLHFVVDEPLRPGAPDRSQADYELLRKYRDRLGADVIALQEVNGPRAAALVFPPDQYDVYFSGRYVEDLVTGKATDPDPEQRSDRIYTGFAVRRGVFDAVSKRDVPSLGVTHTADGRPVRWGTEILLEKDGQLLRLLSVHLKSGCHGGNLENPTDPDCVTLAAQRAPLEAWIDEAAQEGVPFVILGDWNRRIDQFGQNDHLWGEIDDGDPPGLDLRRLPFNREAECNPSFPEPIDFLVFDDRAWQLVDEASFEEIIYDPEDQDTARGTPSDHCPIAVSLELAAPDDGEEPTDTTDLDLLYAPAEGLDGEELRRVLHEIARHGHSRLSYAEVWGALDFTDEDPDNSDNVILLYTGRSHPKPDKVSSTLNPNHDNDSWNREHVWPKSHGFPSEGQLAHTDIHHLRPADVTCNSDRGNLDFDVSDEAHPECASRRDDDSFEPRDAVKGDVARMLFYMDVRYAGADGVPDLELIDDTSLSGPLLGHLCTLLAWNEVDPVDDLEHGRHERIVEVQGNRNPFVDRPEFAAAIWGTACGIN